MKSRKFLTWIPIAVAALAAGALFWLSGIGFETDSLERGPGPDSAAAAEEAVESIPFATDVKRQTGKGTPATLTGSWPGFRGPDRTGIITVPKVKLLTKWSDKGPEAKWQIPLGEGYGGAAVEAGRVYVLDHDKEAKRDVLRSLSLENGKEIWNVSYPAKMKRNFGYTRTVPAIGPGFVVSLGPKGQLLAVSPDQGEVLWTADLVSEYQSMIPAWYMGQCPLVDGKKVVVAPGAGALMAAYDGLSGALLWKIPNPESWQMTHASIGVATVNGRRLYLYPASKGLVVVDAETGTLVLADDTWRVRVSNVPTPVFAIPDRVFLTGGYNAGSRLSRFDEIVPGELELTTVWEVPAEEFGSHVQTPVFHSGCFIAVNEKEQLSCLDEAGKVQWTSGSELEFGLGPFIIVNDLLFALAADGTLHLGQPQGKSLKLLASAKVLPGPDAWAPLAFADGLLLARDPENLVCLKVGE
jgi:outer membrane protein assembly factor BamB